MKKDRIEEWNQLLKGTNMGQHVFGILKNKCRDFHVREELEYSIHIFEHHKQVIQNYLLDKNANIEDKKTWKQQMVEWMCWMKYLFIRCDQDILKEALKSIYNGKEALHIFQKRHRILEASIQRQLELMENDYMCIHKNLKNCKYLLTNA